jgi:3-oxoacyl-[acyl-carrier-protein] synthase III
VTAVSVVATAAYLPEHWMPAAEIAARTGIPPAVLEDKFGLRGKHVASPNEHVSDMALRAAQRLLDENAIDVGDIDAVVYCGSTWKDYAVWHVAPHIAHRLGATRAFALELDYVSCGTPVALRIIRDMLLAEPGLRTVLLVTACRESHLLDYENGRGRLLLSFGDGAAAALLVAGGSGDEVLGSHMITDGSFSLDVKVPAGGSVEPASPASIAAGRHFLEVADPTSLKSRLDPISLPRFMEVAEEALRRSDATLADVAYVCPTHVKPSMHKALVRSLGLEPADVAYLDDTGHMSGVDPLLGFDRVRRASVLGGGDLVLLLAAGTGYTWAATVIRVAS